MCPRREGGWRRQDAAGTDRWQREGNAWETREEVLSGKVDEKPVSLFSTQTSAFPDLG